MEPRFLDLIPSDNTVLEKEPMEEVASTGQLNAFKHEGFWQCMDGIRDRTTWMTYVKVGCTVDEES